MLEISLRKLHRYLGVGIAPLILLQVVSGLLLSIKLLSRWQNDVASFLHDINLPTVAAFWDRLFYEIHLGSGTLGFLYTLLVAFGLIGLTLSGVLIFIKVMVRSRPTKTATIPDAKKSRRDQDDIDTSPRRRVVVALVFAASGLMAIDIFMFATAYRLIGLHAPHLYAIQQIQSNISRSRTALERLMAEESNAPVATINYGLNRARSITKVLLEKEEQKDYVVTGVRRDILPVEEKARGKVEEIAKVLDVLIEKSEWRDLARRLRTEDVMDENSFRRSIELLDSSAEELAEEMMDELERDKERIFEIHLVLFCLASLFLIFVGGLIYTYDTGRKRQLKEILAAREIAHAYQRRFQELIRQSADPLLVFDRNGDILSASLTAANLLGYTEEELLKLNIANIDHKVDAGGSVKGQWGNLSPKAPTAIKCVWRHRSGEQIPVVLSVSLVDGEGDGSAPLILVLARLEETHV